MRAGSLGSLMIEDRMQFTDEEKAVIINALEMRLQRCKDNNWLAEAQQIRMVIEKMNNSNIAKGE